MKWYQSVREKTEYIFQAITTHDFILKLLDGTLPKETFEFYINQDSFYLKEYKRVLSKVGIKCRQDTEIQFFLESATGILGVEEALHETFLKGVNLEAEPSPTCELYTSYLTRMVHNETASVGIAAVLPCFTIYKEVGDFLLAKQSSLAKENPYQNWIDTYGGEDFADSVNKAVEIANRHAETADNETLELMNDAFLKSSKLEWMFWDSAYQREQWSI